MSRRAWCLVLVAGCAHRAAVPVIAAKPAASPAASDRPAGIVIYRTVREANVELTWIDLTSGARGTIPADDYRHHVRYERRGAGVAALVENDDKTSGYGDGRWRLTEDKAQEVAGAMCVGATKAAPHCFVLPVVESVGNVIELEDNSFVVASWPGPRYPVWRVDAETGTVTDLGVVLSPPSATARWIVWDESKGKSSKHPASAKLFVRPLADAYAAPREIDLGPVELHECEGVPGHPDALLCVTYTDKTLGGRGVFLADLAAGTKRLVGTGSSRRAIVSPDGRWFAQSISDTNADDSRIPERIIVKPITGGEPRTITLRAAPGQEPVAWIP
jgi:hypothetical protein